MKSASARSAVYTLVCLWFFWGVTSASNGILIPLFKKEFGLSQQESQYIDLVFYAAYFVGSILYFLISKSIGGDILNRIGYKNGIVYGFLISALGTLLFLPAAQFHSYALLLGALFVVGLGFSIQQTTAQPYMIALGDPATGEQRINLGGSAGNLGTTIGPVLLSVFIFGSVKTAAPISASLDLVKVPYLILGLLFLGMAAFFRWANLPQFTNEEKLEIGTGALKFPQLRLGMAAIFVYVGTEVSIGSNLGEYLRVRENLGTEAIAPYISLFWGSSMMGRWAMAAKNVQNNPVAKNILTVLLPFVSFGLVLGINFLYGSPIQPLLAYAVCILGMLLALFLGRGLPIRTLLIFALCGAVSMAVGVWGSGRLALYALIAGGLFCSVLWPIIFSLGLLGLGSYTNQGSAWLVMMILGGALIPVLQGRISDQSNIQFSFMVPLLGFLFLAFFAWQVKKVLLGQGVAQN
jgi:FHS family L-fucose permease-like MFS transporter